MASIWSQSISPFLSPLPNPNTFILLFHISFLFCFCFSIISQIFIIVFSSWILLPVVICMTNPMILLTPCWRVVFLATISWQFSRHIIACRATTNNTTTLYNSFPELLILYSLELFRKHLPFFFLFLFVFLYFVSPLLCFHRLSLPIDFICICICICSCLRFLRTFSPRQANLFSIVIQRQQ